MKQIQDAAKVIARRCDQNSLQAACHLTLLANEKQQGQLYAQQVVTRYLANHQWKQALAFLKEHQPLKVIQTEGNIEWCKKSLHKVLL